MHSVSRPRVSSRTLAMAEIVGLGLLLGAVSVACSNSTAPPEVFARPQPTDPSRVRVVVPEVYELANVIIALTTYGQSSSTLVFKSGDYYRRVSSAFSSLRNQSLMQDLQLGTSDPLRRYYEMRDNSFSYVFEDGEIRRIPGSSTLRNPNLFAERRTAVEEFADAGGFRDFFAANASFYADMIARYREMADVDSMADWLEREFRPVRYGHYTVVLSPLVYGSHSAQFIPGTDEGIFFVAGPDVTAGTTDGVRKATVQRILFTEVDHAFVNPITETYQSRINNIFGARSKWTTESSSFYDSPVAVFNEYMTWATFLLFVDGRLSDEDFEVVRNNTVQLMEGSRRFQRFGAFLTELDRLYRSRPAGSRVADLYPQILDWAGTQ